MRRTSHKDTSSKYPFLQYRKGEWILGPSFGWTLVLVVSAIVSAKASVIHTAGGAGGGALVLTVGQWLKRWWQSR